MDSPERGALKLVRLIGVLLLVVSLLNLGLYWAKCALAKPAVPMEILPCIVKSLPFVAGVVVFIKAKALAEWLSDQLDL